MQSVVITLGHFAMRSSWRNFLPKQVPAEPFAERPTIRCESSRTRSSVHSKRTASIIALSWCFPKVASKHLESNAEKFLMLHQRLVTSHCVWLVIVHNYWNTFSGRRCNTLRWLQIGKPLQSFRNLLSLPFAITSGNLPAHHLRRWTSLRTIVVNCDSPPNTVITHYADPRMWAFGVDYNAHLRQPLSLSLVCLQSL